MDLPCWAPAVLLRSEPVRHIDQRVPLYQAASDPKLIEVVECYAGLVQTLYQWLEKRMHELHAPAFQETDRPRNLIQELSGLND